MRHHTNLHVVAKLWMSLDCLWYINGHGHLGSSPAHLWMSIDYSWNILLGIMQCEYGY